MRILFFTNAYTPNKEVKHAYNGGGWIDSLLAELKLRKDIELGICSLTAKQASAEEWEGIRFYSIPRQRRRIKEKIHTGFFPHSDKYERMRWVEYKSQFARVVEDFSPEVIHLFGSEFYHGLVAEVTSVPVVLHIQGILNTCLNAWFPPGVSFMDYLLQDYHPQHIWSRAQIYYEWERECMRERHIFKHVPNFIGRTTWDKACTRVLSPSAKYFYGGELLRPIFYQGGERQIPSKLTLVTTISRPLYKGYDFVLKTAQCLKEALGDNFEWKVFGNISPTFVEQKLRISHKDVNVSLCGVATPENLKDHLLHATVYFHSSYIENLCNAACEALILGVPVVAAHVGGIDGAVEHGVDGFLVPANDPYTAAYRILQLAEDRELNIQMGNEGRCRALKRHDKEEVVKTLLATYQTIIHAAR